MEFNLSERTIFLTVTGSHAYGTSTPTSDMDIRGVAVAPLSFCTGFLRHFEQAEGASARDALPSDWTPVSSWQTGRQAEIRAAKDFSVMDLRKFCKLASDANPNVLELLFVDERFWLRSRMPWRLLIDARESFLSKKVRYTFAGYAHAQLKRIRTHRRWLLMPPKEKPTRAAFGLPEHSPIPHDQWKAAASLVERRIQDWLVNPQEEIPVTVLSRVREAMTDMVATIATDQDPEAAMANAAGRQLGFTDNFLQLLAREKGYRSASNEWNQYQTWLAERNPARSELESRFGYDTKHGSHLVRLMRHCEELLTRGTLTVLRDDAEELRSIRAGAWTYERLEEFAEAQDKRMKELYRSSSCPLSREPGRVEIDGLCSQIQEHWRP